MKPRQTKARKPASPEPSPPPRIRAPRQLPPAVRTALCILLALFAFFFTCPIRYHYAAAGLDHSWAFALNRIAESPSPPIVFGRDTAFTYGPFAWLALPMGANIPAALAVQWTLWLAFGAFLVAVAIRTRIPIAHWAIFAIACYAGSRTFTQFGYAGPDLFAAFFALCLLAFVPHAAGRNRWILLCAALALAVALFFVKLSSGILALSAILTWTILHSAFDRAFGLRAAAIAWLGAPALFTFAFLLYHPSLTVMLQYVRSGLEISSGYSAAMSLPETPADLRQALAILAAWLILAIVFATLRSPTAALAFAFLGPFFLTFKHAIVRPAGHIEMLFFFAPLLLGILVLSLQQLPPRRPWLSWLAIAIFTCVWLYRSHWILTPQQFFNGPTTAGRIPEIAAALHPAQLATNLAAASRDALAPDALPPLPANPTAFFPSELSYAAANPIPLQPLPVLQSYSAYTAPLDEWTAQTLRDPGKAPRQILLEWTTIDGRHPLLDTPATALEILRHYDLAQTLGPRLLLSRRAQPRFSQPRPAPVTRTTARLGQPVTIDNSSAPRIARLNLRLTLQGRLAHFFYKVPEMRILLASRTSGRTMLARAIPAVLENGIPVNFTPVDLATFQDLIVNSRVQDPFDTFVLSGEAVRFYEPEFSIDWYEPKDYVLQLQPAPPPTLETLTSTGNSQTARIETLNSQGVTGLAANEVLAVDCTQGYLAIQGWALDEPTSKPAAAVLIALDDRFYPAQYGAIRMDIVGLFREPEARNSGFFATPPVFSIDPAKPHTLALRVLSRDQKSFATGTPDVKFRCR